MVDYKTSSFTTPSKYIPFIKSEEYAGNRLLINGQPIVVAGGVIMRKYIDAEGNENVDFPTLVGNQFNEFTVEFHASSGLPVSTPGPTGSSEWEYANREAGKIYLPQAVSFVPRKIPFNPAALSTEALWYVSNPSYSWMDAVINFCSSDGFISQMQVMTLSSYSPMALWRIQYQSSSCFLRFADQRKICSPNVSRAMKIDSARDFPSLSSADWEKSTSFVDICLSSQEFNLWAENMEDFDEFNVVIGVRRGTMKDMGFLLDTLQASGFGDLKFSETRGRVVFYFVSKLSWKIRESEPWTLKDHLISKGPKESPAVSLYKMSCPQLRVLPDVGNFVSHSLAAVLYLFKVPVNMIMNPFSLLELLEARGLKRCPENSLRHSAAEDCGLAILSLSNYFHHMYEASEAFWAILSWVLFKITGGVENEMLTKEAMIFSQFLQGGVVLGDATKIISLFDITKIMESLDTGAENVIFNTGKGRRRRLLEEDDDGGSDDEESSKGSGKGILSKIAGAFKNIFSGMFSITTSSAQLISGNPFSGADLGMLLASQDPVSSMVPISITAPGLAWAQVTYESLVPIGLDFLANAKNGLFTVKPLWVHMYDTMDLYDSIIHERHKRMCMGYRLLLGYGSSFGKAIQYVCLAAAEMPRSTWTVILTLFVDINLYRCMCINTAGQEFLKYSYENCEYLISPNRKGLWQSILNSNSIENVCQEFESNIQAQLYKAFDGWTSLSYEAANAITNFLDELFVQRSHAFDCNNIESNPSAIVLTPLPVNHFHVCGKTSSCKTRCEESIMVFEAEYNVVQKSASDALYYKKESYNTDVESPFFNKYNNDWSSSGGGYNVLQKRNSFVRAIYTTPFEDYLHPLHPCKTACTMSTEGRCIRSLVETIGTSLNSFEVMFFCMPEPGNLLSSIYKTGTGTFSLQGMEEWKNEMSFVEFSVQNTSYTDKTYLISYIFKRDKVFELNDIVDKQTKIINTNEVYLWKSDGIGKGWKTKILSTQEIMARLMTADMQTSLYGYEFTVVDSFLSNCEILTMIELYSKIPGEFLFAFSFRVSIEVTLKGTNDEQGTVTKNERHMFFGLLSHCDPSETFLNSAFNQQPQCESKVKFYIPETTCGDLEIPSCNENVFFQLENIIEKTNQGTLHHVENNQYMFIPRNSMYETSDPLVSAEPYLQWLAVDILTPQSSKIEVKAKYRVDQSDSVTMDLLGSFSRSDVFQSGLVVNKKYRDVKFYRDKNTSKLYYYQINAFKSTTSIASEWIEQVRLSYGRSAGYQLRAYSSNNYSIQSKLVVKCSTSSCIGCSSPRLRLLCAQAQNCILAKCIGTIVQTRNVFCGIGNVFESMSKHAIITWNAMYNSVIELLLVAMKGINGEMVQVIALKFPTDQFYALLCSVKDSYASMVGMGMSIIQMLSNNLFSSSGLVKGLSISGSNEEIGVLMGEKTLKIKSIGNLFFNMLTGSTLLPTMALHKFLICTINASMASEFNDLGSLSVSFVDVAMDKTWLECAKVGGMSSILNSIDLGTSLGNVIETFTQFSLSLLSGLGQTILYALQLSFDATMDFFISLVWSLQDIITTFNVRACKVPNFALRYVLWCSCQDDAYRIPESRRDDGREEGALWCVGTLSVNLLDGTQNALVYNPYPMKVLDESMENLVAYIYCRSTAMDSTTCDNLKRPHDLKLNILSRQGVDPLVVWSKCKSNYLQSVWDNGAGAIFMEDSYEYMGNQKNNPFVSYVSKGTRAEWKWWALSISPQFLECLQEPSRVQYDYSSCMRIYFDKKTEQTPNSYFIYDKDKFGVSNFPPDGCKVFTGIAKGNNASSKNQVQTLFENCVLEQENIGISASNVQYSENCELNHVIWSTKNPQKRAVASLHGTSPEWSEVSNPETKKAIQLKYWNEQKNIKIEELKRAWKVFNDSFQKDALEINVALFTADGDLIHNFFDCMYLGPYTRVDLIPCDQENVLECEFYARDEFGGKSRNFTACLGNDVMHNDSRPPYTCGSRARRSLIKYFFREMYEHAQLKANITKKINEKITSIINNYTADASLGCYNEASKSCHPQYCNLQNGFAPCLSTNYDITGMEMADFLMETILPNLRDFYQNSMQDSKYWTLHSNKSMKPGLNPYPFQWKNDIEQSKAALDMGHYAPNKTIQTYSTGEVYSMPLYNASEKDRKLGSLWSLCMSLLAQPSLNHPVENKTLDNKNSYTVPVGLWEIIVNAVRSSSGNLDVMETLLDMSDGSIVATTVKNMIKANMKSHSPHFWQRSKRHGPSQSNFCKKKERYEQIFNTKPSKIVLKNMELSYTDEVNFVKNKILIEREQFEHMWHEGFLKRTIGNSHVECTCSFLHAGQTQCLLQEATCNSLSSLPANSRLRNQTECLHLFEACKSGGTKSFDFKAMNNDTLVCLQNSQEIIWCPEFGLSDLWGFFPVDCGTEECDTVDLWNGLGSEDVEYNPLRFLIEGRGGMRISNYKHHNETYHHEMNYRNKKKSASAYAFEKCFTIQDMYTSDEVESKENLLVDSIISTLFPVVQVVHESHVTASCSRYIIEIARLQILETIGSSQLDNALLQAKKWKTKCESKVRHLSICNMMGMYFDIPPPEDWKALASEKCNIELTYPTNEQGIFMTPWCLTINQTSRKVYDTHQCLKNVEGAYSTKSEQKSNIGMNLNLVRNSLVSIYPTCELFPDPFSFLQSSTRYDENLDQEFISLSSVSTLENTPLLPVENWMEELHSDVTLQTVYDMYSAAHIPARDLINQVYDWWPEDLLRMPAGFHVTSSIESTEFNPVVLDSHFVYDESTQTAFYTHTSLRNESLFHDHMGAVGLCRSPSIGMPLFDTNTNVLCTRVSKFASQDIPTHPVSKPKTVGGNMDGTEWPYSTEYIEKTFYEEKCTTSRAEIPWVPTENDFLGRSIGSIPSIQYLMFMDQKENIYYDSSDGNKYPPEKQEDITGIHDLNIQNIFGGNDQNWSTCAKTISWKAGIDCDTKDTSKMCPDLNSVCLAFHNDTTEGICFPTIVYARSIVKNENEKRLPCFASFHCPDKQVCLADGGCFEPYLHLWNNLKAPMEHSVISNECGFDQKEHPYEQNTRGSSPWEKVDDLLHMHGFCSHRNWWSYRQAIRRNLCPEDKFDAINAQFLKCSNTTKWPWIKESYSGNRPTDDIVPTLHEEHSLFVTPQKCDTNIFHLGHPENKHTRLKFCSGYEGHQSSKVSSSVIKYPLSKIDKDWNNMNLFSYKNVNANFSKEDLSWWLRTYNEKTNETYIGKVGFSQYVNDFPLGFLGASATASSAFSSMTSENLNKDNFKFFKCSKRIQCTLPPFTYNGISRLRINPTYHHSPNVNASQVLIQERHIRKCGSVGYIPEAFENSSQSICALDLSLFPLFINLNFYSATSSCSKILWEDDFFKSTKLKIIRQNKQAILQLKSVNMNEDYLYCQNTFQISEETLCVYKGRQSNRLTSSSSSDHVQRLIARLNSLITESPLQIISKIGEENGAMTTSQVYELINSCVSQLQNNIEVYHNNLQLLYQSKPCGMYYALKVSTFEFPLSLLQHLWYVSILYTMDSRFYLPSFEYWLKDPGSIQLWDNGKEEFCAQDDLNNRNTLLYLICENIYPQFTFEISQYESPVKKMQDKIIEETKELIQRTAGVTKQATKIMCFKKAKWNCESESNLIFREECTKARIFAHNTTFDGNELDFCPDVVREKSFSVNGINEAYLKPCTNPKKFDFEEAFELTSEYLQTMQMLNSRVVDARETNENLLKQYVTNRLPDIFEVVDYTKKMKEEVLQADNFLTVLNIRKLESILKASEREALNFTFKNWFETELCPSGFPFNYENVCKKQENIPDDSNCLYNTFTDTEKFRYATDSNTDSATRKSVITIEYNANDPDIIDVCDFMEKNDDDAEFCMVQHFGNDNRIVQLINNEAISCDISRIHVPPGIEVQAFAFRKDYEYWLRNVKPSLKNGGKGNMLAKDDSKKYCTETDPQMPDGIKSCSWKRTWTSTTPQRNQWLHARDFDSDGNFNDNAESTGDNKRKYSFLADFTNMLSSVTNGWWKSNPTESSKWQDEGCGNFDGVCAIKFRFETVKTKSRGFCASDQYPTCYGKVINSENFKIRPFAVAKTSFPSRDKLYRCDQCIKKENYLWENGVFNCHLEDKNQPGIPISSSGFTIDELKRIVPFLYFKEDAKNKMSMDTGDILDFVESGNDDKLKVKVQLVPNAMKSDYLGYWKNCKDDDPKINTNLCYKSDDFLMDAVEFQDNEIWNFAIENPQKDTTMDCSEQNLNENTDLKTCNQEYNGRRTQLKEFTQNVYRERLGTWFLKTKPNEGLAWRSMTSRPSTKYFSLVFASSVRPEKDVETKYILSERPCREGNLQDRVCFESIANSKLPFEVLNPWFGGDFNPFEGKAGLDLCLIQNSNFREVLYEEYKQEKYYLGKKSFCLCECQPESTCKNNPNETFNSKEFPTSDEQCSSRMYPQIHVMNDEDPSNICFYGKNRISEKENCNHFQGILGGLKKPQETVTTEHFHSERGIPLSKEEMIIQGMYGDWSDLNFENNGQSLSNGLWKGKTLLEEGNVNQNYAFLKMERRDMHPAHIAFSFDLTRTNNPLVVKGIRLLPYNKKEISSATSSEIWLENLKSKWLQDIKLFESVYPIKKTASGENQWSCPFRLFSFWGNPTSETFSPHIPNPLLNQIIFSELKGAHPLVQLKSIQNQVGNYKTTNGMCFYEETNIEHLDISNTLNPCGLYKMIENLVHRKYFPSKIMNHFKFRCNLIMDYPGFEATLHNGEVSDDADYLFSKEKCGLLHRLTPFLARVHAQKSFLQKNKQGLTTHSEGGDCHMGRAFKVKFNEKSNILLGQGTCLLSQKSKTRGILQCWNRKAKTKIALERHEPLPLQTIVAKKYRTYQSELLEKKYFIKYQGKTKSNVVFQIPDEISYGIPLYTSISKMLSDDLINQCNGNPCEKTSTWKGGKEFLLNYAFFHRNLVRPGSDLSEISKRSNDFVALFLKKTNNTRGSAFAKAMERDQTLWNAPNWTWSYYTIVSKNNGTQDKNCDAAGEKELVRNYVGTVHKKSWKKNRFEACNASLYEHYINNPNIKSKCDEGSVRKFSMCEPAPTASLQKLCNILSTFKLDIQHINCVVWGNGNSGNDTCLYKPSMMYLPFAWSNTNGEFSSETVLDYYTDVIATKFPTAAITDVCPSRSDLEYNSRKLRLEVKNRCPATQIDFLKETLDTLKKLGKDMIYMCYCAGMCAINLVASLFMKSMEASLATMEHGMYYMEQFFMTIQKIIMPILNVIIQILFGISSAGKVFAGILETVCMIFKEVYNNVVVYLWCSVAMPIIEIIIIILKGVLGIWDSRIGKALDDLWRLLSGGHSGFNVQACVGRLQVNIKCTPQDRNANVNESLDSLSPLATPCWVDSVTKSGYSDVFSGSSEFSYLSCSLSDTCTTDPTSFDYDIFSNDKTTNLVSCASCPNNIGGTDDNVKKFGCNNYLKRCSCSVPQRSISECVTNEDCSITSNNAICSIASTIDGTRNSFSTSTCSDCGRMGMRPVCIIDGTHAMNGGVCACGSVNEPNFLASCPDTALGERIDILDKTGQCLISSNENILSVQVSNIFLDFKDLSIGPCALGIQGYNNHFCVRVTLPLENGLDAGYQSFVVLTNTNMNYGGLLQGMLSGSVSGRRLLSVNKETNSTSLQWAAASHCSDILQQNRKSIKGCIEEYLNLIQWYMMEYNVKEWNTSHVAEYVAQNLNSSNSIIFWGKYTWNITSGNPLAIFTNKSTAQKIQTILKKQKGFFYMLLDWCLGLYWSGPILTTTTTLDKNIINWKAFESKQYSLDQGFCKTANISFKTQARRRLLQNTESSTVVLKPLPVTCKTIQEPLHRIKNAFWITAEYYGNAQQEKIQNKSLDNEPFMLYRFFSSFPNQSSTSAKSINNNNGEVTQVIYSLASYSLSFLLTGQLNAGEEVINSFSSNLSYEESVEGNYFTGKRIIKELSTCQYNLLTYGPSPPRKLLPWFFLLTAIMVLLTNCFFTSGIVNWVMWIFVFPSLLFWTVYSVSPLCFPMVPTKLMHDVKTELEVWIPSKIEVPYFLTKSSCLDFEQIMSQNQTMVVPVTKNLAEKLSKIQNPERCFKSCKENPFLMKSWLDPLAWWTCEISVSSCRYMGKWLSGIVFFRDFTSSVEYYSEVLEFESKNAQFTQAHRFCAIFNIHEILIVLFMVICIVLMIPSAFEFLVEIFSSALILVFQASNAENTF